MIPQHPVYQKYLSFIEQNDCTPPKCGRLSEKHATKATRERNVLFNDALNTFYLWLYGVRHMVKDHSDS